LERAFVVYQFFINAYQFFPKNKKAAPQAGGSISSDFYSLKQLRCLFFNNRDDATARRNVCFAHFFVVLRRAFGAAK
jgi:hypothetical protein